MTGQECAKLQLWRELGFAEKIANRLDNIHIGDLVRRPEMFAKKLGLTDRERQRLRAFVSLHKHAVGTSLERGSEIDGPQAVYEHFRELGFLDHEEFWSVILDTRNRLLDSYMVARGGLASVSMTPIEVFRTALLAPAKSIILVHNHPSGDPKPSASDIALTERLISAGELIGILVQDHIVIANDSYSSMAELGLVNF